MSCSEPINQYRVSKLSQILDYGLNNSLSSENYRYYVGHHHVIGRADTGYMLIFIQFPLTQWSPLASHLLELFSNSFEHFICLCTLKLCRWSCQLYKHLDFTTFSIIHKGMHFISGFDHWSIFLGNPLNKWVVQILWNLHLSSISLLNSWRNTTA